MATEKDQLTQLLIDRMKWPSMHWRTQSLDPEAARGLAEWIIRSGWRKAEPCICNTGPDTDGPEETCPQHGRSVTDWIERSDVLADRLAAVEEERDRLAARLATASHETGEVI